MVVPEEPVTGKWGIGHGPGLRAQSRAAPLGGQQKGRRMIIVEDGSYTPVAALVLSVELPPPVRQ